MPSSISNESTPVATTDPAGGNHPGYLPGFVMALFFIFGGITSLNDVIIPKLKELFTLNYTQAMLIQFCFFTAYAVIGLPGARIVKKIGYMRGAVVGLVTMMAGCLLFIPAAAYERYELFLFALFVLASGVVIVQVVANPLISLLGPARTAHSRLTFAQAFNSLGTTVFPIVGATLILGSLTNTSADQLTGEALQAYRVEEASAIVFGYSSLALIIALVAGTVWWFRDSLTSEQHEETALFGGIDLLKQPRFRFGAACIFFYVGAEVAIGSLIVSFLSQEQILGIDEMSAGKLVGLYFGGAMVGRFAGSLLLRIISPGKLLAAVASGAIVLLMTSILSSGEVAGYSLLAIGLMNSIMFPTIFALACEGLGPRLADGSGIINVAIVGGAIVPLLTGVIADVSRSLSVAFLLPAVCYAMIVAFGWYARRPRDSAVV
ncbi:MAG: sugar MFS transporter [Steroidobacteraceae bacterium]